MVRRNNLNVDQKRCLAVKSESLPIHAGKLSQNLARSASKSAQRFSLVLVVLLFLTACTSSPTQLNQFTGTQGITIKFANNAPPAKIFEGTPFPVKLEVHNAGALPVPYNKMVITFSTDPLYITGGVSPFIPTLHDPDIKSDKTLTALLGRSLIYPSGETRLFSIAADNAFGAKQVYGQREAPKTTIDATVCYAYTTMLSASVCIDTNMYAQNERKQACSAKDLSFAGGQGAPIAITQVEVHSLPVINAGAETIRPQFTIHIQDVGQGILVGPDNLQLNDACLLKKIPPESLGAIRINARLYNTVLDCGKSNIVKLTDGKAEVSCTVPNDKLDDPVYSATQNFETMLSVNLTYIYKTSASADIEIDRIPGSQPETVSNQPGHLSGYMYKGDTPVRDDRGNPVTECAYYAQHRDEAQTPVDKYINSAYSCACGPQTCLDMNRATPFSCLGGLCPGDSYCCAEKGPTDGGTGATMGISDVTVYYTPECNDYQSWSSSNGAYTGSHDNCVYGRGFYEAVMCEGSGYCNGKYYSYKNSIAITEALSKPVAAPLTSAGSTAQAHHSIAVNTHPGTPCYVPKGSRIKLDFGANNPWNGEYVADDVGQDITYCHIDVYAGQGKSSYNAAVSALPKTATLTIIS